MSMSKCHDGISSELVIDDISSCITLSLFINQSLTTGIFPDQLKNAKVTPVYKKCDKKFINNYRPISVLTVISKVFDSVIFDQLTEFFLLIIIFSAYNSMGSGRMHLLRF